MVCFKLEKDLRPAFALNWCLASLPDACVNFVGLRRTSHPWKVSHYGVVKEDYLLIKGCCIEQKKWVVTLRQSILKQTSRLSMEEIKLKFIHESCSSVPA